MAHQSALTRLLSHLLILTIAGILSFPFSLMVNVPYAHAITYTVTNTNDAGAGSLRQAILDANGNADTDTINFAGTLSGTISTSSDMTTISEALIIDGSTASNALTGPDIIINATGEAHCLKFDAGTGSQVKGIGCTGPTDGIVVTSNVTGATIGGTGAREGNEWNGCSGSGISIPGGDNLTFYNNAVGNTTANGTGISISGISTGITIGGTTSGERNTIAGNTTHGISIVNGSATIKGNYIGTVSGSNDVGNGSNGINIGSGVTNTFIGGTTAGDGNIISGNNQNGIAISNSAITVQGNYIGVNAAGTGDLGNSQSGILIQSSKNLIGGTVSAARNIISGNDSHGIKLSTASTANDNVIQMNYIGTNAAGTAALANTLAGIYFESGTMTGTTIGGTGYGNVISGNGQSGIGIIASTATASLIYGNTIGLAADNTTALGNGAHGINIQADGTIIGEANTNNRRNFIASNGGQGIWINGADSTTVVNNYIGLASDGTTARANTSNALAIDTTGASNTIGGTASGAGNVMSAASSTNCVNIAADAGNYNNIRANNCLSSPNTSGNVVRNGSSNEGIVTPTVTSGSTTSYVSGTSSTASGLVDIFGNGVYLGSATANSSGAWEKHVSVSVNGQITANITNPVNSTSSTSASVTATLDSTVPAQPLVSSPANNSSTASGTITLTGTKEANTSIRINGAEQVANNASTTWSVSSIALNDGQNNFSIITRDFTANDSSPLNWILNRDTITPSTPTLSYASNQVGSATITGTGTEVGASVILNGNDTGTNVDALGNFAIYPTVQTGENILSIVIRDDAGNSSTAATATITNTAGGGSGGGGGGTTTSTSTASSSETAVGGIVEPTDSGSMAGESEPDPEPAATPQPSQGATSSGTSPSVETTPTSTPVPVESPSQNNVKPAPVYNPSPIKSFIQEIIKIVEPIKQKNLRENLPPKPASAKKYNTPLLDGGALGPKNNLGVPQILVEIKLGGEDPLPDRDTDGDGLFDYEEVLYGGDPKVKDADGDGYSDLDEVFVQGTDPSNYDSDKDGRPDVTDKEPMKYNAPEVKPSEILDYIADHQIGTPLGQTDSDGDGISDLHEMYLSTNPQDEDSDADGIPDGDEVFYYGTDPNTTTSASAAGVMRVVNASNEETVEEGEQFYVGNAQADAVVQIQEINEDGTLTVLGETVADEEGRFALLTDVKLSVGTHNLVLTSGENEIEDISSVFSVKAIERVSSPEFVNLGIEDITEVANDKPILSLKSSADYLIMVVWQSTVYSQTVITDYSGQILDFQVPKELELGDHSVTWYAVDLETNEKSSPTQVNFNVSDTTAFVRGENIGSNWLVITLGSLAILSSLTALALFFRSRRIGV